MWGALTAVAGHVPLPLSGRDYLELLPVRWLTINDHGIRLGQRTYDHDLLGPYRGQPSPVAARAGRWEVHHNPHDLRQIWVRLPDRDDLVEIPWIHRDHVHHPFDDRTWDHIRTTALRRGNHDQHEADLAQALDDLQRRATTGGATRTEQAVLARAMPARIPHPTPATRQPDAASGTGRTTSRPPSPATTDTGAGAGAGGKAAAQPAPRSGDRLPRPGAAAGPPGFGAQQAGPPRSWARLAADGHPGTPADGVDDAGAVPADGPGNASGSADEDGLAEDADGLLDPDDPEESEDDFGPGDRWPHDTGTAEGAHDNGSGGTDGEGPWNGEHPGDRTGQEQDVDGPDDAWDDAGGDRHSPVPPYTGLGLWDARKEAERW